MKQNIYCLFYLQGQQNQLELMAARCFWVVIQEFEYCQLWNDAFFCHCKFCWGSDEFIMKFLSQEVETSYGNLMVFFLAAEITWKPSKSNFLGHRIMNVNLSRVGLKFKTAGFFLYNAATTKPCDIVQCTCGTKSEKWDMVWYDLWICGAYWFPFS